MAMAPQKTMSRRTFLATGTGTGAALVLGFHVGEIQAASGAQADAGAEVSPNAWLRISSDDQIVVLVEIPEMGQGPRTVDAMMVAEELEADWSKIRVEQAPVIPRLYKNLVTGGSGGTPASWDYLRKVGAQAREMLIAAAAQRWDVPKSECKAKSSTVIHLPSGRRASYGELAGAAMRLPVPRAADVSLKGPRDFRLIGTPVPRVDIPGKVDGTAKFGIDVRVPGMLFAVVARCPYFGGKLQSFDASAAKAVQGVQAVFPIVPLGLLPKLERNINTAGGLAVVADSTWSAMQGRRALKIAWDTGPNGSETTEAISKQLKAQAAAPPSFVAVNQGDALKALQENLKKVDAFYELPFQAH